MNTWTIEVLNSALTEGEVSPTIRISGTYQEALDVQRFLEKLMVQTVLSKEGMAHAMGL